MASHILLTADPVLGLFHWLSQPSPPCSVRGGLTCMSQSVTLLPFGFPWGLTTGQHRYAFGGGAGRVGGEKMR